VGYQSVPWIDANVKVVYLLSDALVEKAPGEANKKRKEDQQMQ